MQDFGARRYDISRVRLRNTQFPLPAAHVTYMLKAAWSCRLVKHVSQVRGIVCGQHSQQAAAEKHQLALLLQACTRHVSYIRSDHHGMLVAELLAISLWICGEVPCFCYMRHCEQLSVCSQSWLSWRAGGAQGNLGLCGQASCSKWQHGLFLLEATCLLPDSSQPLARGTNSW